MSHVKIQTEHAPAAIGPYSQAVQAGGTVYVSGQLPINPATGEFAGEDIRAQARQSLENIKAILAAADVYKRQLHGMVLAFSYTRCLI